jgi:hypothetical protein
MSLQDSNQSDEPLVALTDELVPRNLFMVRVLHTLALAGAAQDGTVAPGRQLMPAREYHRWE